MKYEKPKLIEISELAETHGDCANGSAVTDTCAPGPTVAPGCVAGGLPVAVCTAGGNPTT